MAATTVPLVIVGFGYIFWSRINDSGLVGWIDSVQAQNDGKYDAKLSLITAMFYLMIAIAVVLGLLSRLPGAAPSVSRAGPASAAARPRKTAVTQTRMLLFTTLGMAVATWIVGFGAYEYYSLRNRQEMAATYEPVDVSAQTGVASRPAFVALRGRPHPLGSLSLRGEHDSDGTYFVPLVAPSGRDRDAPVHWVVQLSGSYLPPLPLPLRGHDVGGTLSQTTRDAFARMGVRLAPDVVLVSYVPAGSDGVVLDGSAHYWDYFVFGSGFVSVTCLLVFFLAWIGQGIRARRMRRAVLMVHTQQSR